MKRIAGFLLGVMLVTGAALAQEPAQPTWVADGLLTAEEAAEGFYPLFNGKDLDGWWCRGENKNAYQVKEGGLLLVTGEPGGDWLFTNDEFDNFVLRYEYRCISGEGNSGVGIRSPKVGNPAFDGFEIQVIRAKWETPYQRSGALYSVVPPEVEADKPFGEWNSVEVMADGTRIRTMMNGTQLYDANTMDYTPETVKEEWQKPANTRPLRGHIALQDHSDSVEFRNIRVKPLPGGEGWRPLFNGKDLAGWQVLRDPVFHVTPEGCLQVTGPDGWDKGRNGLRTDESFDNFELRLSFRPHSPRANSGVFFRCSGDDPWPRTYEAQVDNHDPKQFTGAIWDQVQASELRAGDDRWNHMRVTADGPHILVWVNGKNVVDYESKKHAGNESGWITLQGHDPGGTVDFKDIEIKPIGK